MTYTPPLAQYTLNLAISKSKNSLLKLSTTCLILSIYTGYILTQVV